MKTLENDTYTRVLINAEGKHRFLMEKVWDKNKPSAGIVMLYPSTADTVRLDLTSMIVINNLYEMGFGGVLLFNLFSKISCQISKKEETDHNHLDNDKVIAKNIDKLDKIILCVKAAENNKMIRSREIDLLKILLPYKEKVVVIEDFKGNRGYNPLTPSARSNWKLVPFDGFTVLEEEKTEDVEDTKAKKKGKKKAAVPKPEVVQEPEEDPEDTDEDGEDEEA